MNEYDDSNDDDLTFEEIIQIIEETLDEDDIYYPELDFED